MPVQTQVQMRRDTAANWTSTNPTLASGEWGLETNTRLMKIGDGTTAWNSLAYQLGPLLDEVIPTDPNGAYFTGSGLRFANASGNVVNSPDSAALDITGDIDIRVKVALDNWSLGPVFVNKYQSGNRSFEFYCNNTGLLGFQWSPDGSTQILKTSTVATGITNGATKWVRVTLDVNNGASGNDVTFYTSDDGSTWTQLGTTVTTAGTTSIFSGTAPLDIGARTAATAILPQPSTFYRIQILNGIAGTTVFDANFESVAADSFAFTESSANAATVTLTTTRYSFGIPGAGLQGTATGGALNNRTIYNLFTVSSKPITVKHLAFEVTTVGASSTTARIAIYRADANGQPTGNALYNSDAITVTNAATGIYRIRITPLTLAPGNYLTAANFGAAAPTIRLGLGNRYSSLPNTMGPSLTRFFEVNATLSGGALPTVGTLWNSRSIANQGILYFIWLGWS